MHKIYETYIPEGFGTVNPYLMVSDPEAYINFLKSAFYAEELDRSLHPETKEILNCILKMGTSCFMIGRASGDFSNMKTSLYLYVNDVDAMHKNAIAQGAKVVFEPNDMEYGDRQSGIIDPTGNYWWISKRLVDEVY